MLSSYNSYTACLIFKVLTGYLRYYSRKKNCYIVSRVFTCGALIKYTKFYYILLTVQHQLD